MAYVAVSGGEFDVDVLEKGFFADSKSDIICTDHICIVPP